VTAAAMKRGNSRGAHYREDFPDAGDMETSHFTVVTQRDGGLEISDAPVLFTRVKPGETLIKETPEAAE
jgi:fumarate reductase flavoprotein subunit